MGADLTRLMDHLGIETFAVVGMCIGGAFIMRLLEEAPERVTAAVEVSKTHKAIAEAMVSGDGELARRRMRRHLEAIGSYLR